jgi:hypothetical protein
VDLLNQKNIRPTLFEVASTYQHIYDSFRDCSRGKRSKVGFQKYHLHFGEKLKELEMELKRTQNYKWGGYREFYVHDPKKRMIMAAPFKDRVVHTILYKALTPVLEPTLGAHTFACRVAMGNSNAVSKLYAQLKLMGENRYCIKLDVKKYFQSIDHEIPDNKKVILGIDPIPFLGFVLDHTTYRPLQRNSRRFGKKLQRLEKSKALPSLKAQVKQSYDSWKILKEKTYEMV